MKNIFLIAACMVGFYLSSQAQNFRKGGYPLEEVTYQWVEQGLEIYPDCEDEEGYKCYFVNTHLATMYYFLEDGLVTKHLVWPVDNNALSVIIERYNQYYDEVSAVEWRLDVPDGLVLINLREYEEEYFFEYTYLVNK